MNNIQNIDIKKLWPHPDNPRKDLGDLSELAESVKTNGILQNLTVVPWFSKFTGLGCDDPKDQEEMGYTVVIGHRRLAAAKLAGLTEIPCVISDMKLRDQVATMLLENMQRADLTIYEQAQGFQMMLDLGDTVKDIAEQTGFSSATVKRRVKLLELDPEKFKASAERNVTLMDYAELEKIEDIDLRNKVLDSIGTLNFKYDLQKAIDKEKSNKIMAQYIEKFNTFATQIDKVNGQKYIATYYTYRYEDIKIPEDIATVKYYYEVTGPGWIGLYCDRTEVEEDISERKQVEVERDQKYKALQEITIRAYNLRHEFVKSISNTQAKKNIEVIIQHVIKFIIFTSYYSVDLEDYAKILGLNMDMDDYEDDDDVAFKELAQGLSAQPEKYLLLAAYCMIDDENQDYFTWNGAYRENKDLDWAYEFLEALGYETSDEEKAMRNGTHELFDNPGR